MSFYFWVGIIALAYYLYWRTFSFFSIVDPKPDGIRNKLKRGKCPPSYPNGWFRLSRSDELMKGYYFNI